MAATPAPSPVPLPGGCADLLVVGAGAAGLCAAIWAGRTAGGRCNVTHWRVTEADYAGSTPAAIRRVLARFGVDETVRFFAAAGVELKREETGKLFPVTDSARTVLDALVREAGRAGVALVHPARVVALEPSADGFAAETTAGRFAARRVILCTGGKSLPKSGSDGTGFALATGLGHTLAEPIVPALVPLVLAPGHWITTLSGLTLPAEVTLATATGRRMQAVTGSTLCTHVGLSGPAILDMSRHWLVARHADPAVRLALNWLPGTTAEELDRRLVDGAARGALAVLRERLADRLARVLCEQAGAATAGDIPRDARRRLATLATATPLEVVGDRGFGVAEATAGGVPLSEVRLETLESRIRPGLHLAGEVLDVDGRIGGFNFQWAWASGFVAGSAAAAALVQPATAAESAAATRTVTS